MMTTAAIFAGMLAVLLVIFFATGSGIEHTRLRRRIARLKTRRAARPQSAEAALSLRKQADGAPSGLLGAIVKRLPHFESVGNRLERAGSPLNAQQFSFRCLLAMLIIIIGTRTLGKPLLLGVFLGIILAVWLPLKVLSFRIGRKQKAFLQVFPDAIDLIVRGLRSGLPVAESVNLVAQEVPEPVSGAFKHAANTMKLGVSMEKALQEVARKLNYTEFNFFVTSIILQRETGGNLSEILNNLSEVLRKRYMMRMKIKAMTSEARASSMIIGALPFLVGGAVSVMSPDYIKVLFTDYRGNEALAVAAGMMGFGMWVMNRMAKFEI